MGGNPQSDQRGPDHQHFPDERFLFTYRASSDERGLPASHRGQRLHQDVDRTTLRRLHAQSTQGNAPTNTTYWQLIAEKGTKGDTGATGQTGATGNGISSVAKTSTSSNVDTYTITYTNGTTTTFDVTNANVVNEISSGSGNTYSCDVINELVGDIESILTNLDVGNGVGE